MIDILYLGGDVDSKISIEHPERHYEERVGPVEGKLVIILLVLHI